MDKSPFIANGLISFSWIRRTVNKKGRTQSAMFQPPGLSLTIPKWHPGANPVISFIFGMLYPQTARFESTDAVPVTGGHLCPTNELY
jgi:hypothetical protein